MLNIVDLFATTLKFIFRFTWFAGDLFLENEEPTPDFSLLVITVGLFFLCCAYCRSNSALTSLILVPRSPFSDFFWFLLSFWRIWSVVSNKICIVLLHFSLSDVPTRFAKSWHKICLRVMMVKNFDWTSMSPGLHYPLIANLIFSIKSDCLMYSGDMF